MSFFGAEQEQNFEQLMTLYQHEVNNQEEERKQLADFLNDGVQTLSALHIQLAMLHMAPEAQVHSDLATALPILADLMSTLSNAARQLRPLELDSLGLNQALELAVEAVNGVDNPLITYEGHNIPELPAEVATAFYRLAEEAIKSVCQHNQRAEMFLQLKADEQCVYLTIQDNGNGLTNQIESDDLFSEPGLHLLGLMVRFQQLNGRITLENQAGLGNVITAVWPYRKETSDDTPGRDPI